MTTHTTARSAPKSPTLRAQVLVLGLIASAFISGAPPSPTAHALDASPLTPSSGDVAGGQTVTLPAPTAPITPLTLTSISAGDAYALAIGNDQHTYAWGANAHGQLGTGTTTDSSLAQQVVTPSGVRFTQVSAGETLSLALGDDGNTYAWGDNTFGQLGNGTTTDSAVPVAVHLPEGVHFTHISAGGSFALALGTDGHTYAWGDNSSGQLGNGSTQSATQPSAVAVPNGVSFTAVRAGEVHALALGTDGRTYAWGSNTYGQLGTGATTDAHEPVTVATPDGVAFTGIDASNLHSLGITEHGAAYAWGYNTFGELETDPGAISLTPVEVPLPEGAAAHTISGGRVHSLTLTTAGNALAWGENIYGQLGNGTTTSSSVPVTVATPDGVTLHDISAGSFFSVAVASDGSAYAWGRNNHGQLGNGTTEHSPTPVHVRTVDPVAEVTRVSFGDTPATELNDPGTGTVTVTTPSHAAGIVDVTVEWAIDGIPQTPVVHPAAYEYQQAPTVTNPTDQHVFSGATATFHVTATGHPDPKIQWQHSTDEGANWHDIAATTDPQTLTVVGTHETSGSLYRAVATNTAGTATSQAARLTVRGAVLSGAIAGNLHTVALGDDGNVYGWGRNDTGQLGNGTSADTHTPGAATAPAGVAFTTVHAGSSHTVATGNDGNAYAWGSNGSGQLGNGNTTTSTTPVAIAAPNGVRYTEVFAGGSHSLAMGDDGNVYAWGANGAGQLGNGSTTNSLTPVRVATPAGVTFSALTVSSAHTLAIGSDGHTYGWGQNATAALGDGSIINAPSPVRVAAPNGVRFTSVVTGAFHSLAVATDGHTYAWGSNSHGQIGNGDNITVFSPTQVRVPSGVQFTHLTAGAYHSVAIANDGHSYAWGANSDGRLGDGTTNASRVPVRVAAPSGVQFTGISAGLFHTAAQGDDGHSYAWGGNDYGQVGNGTNWAANVPVRVVDPQH